MKTQLRALTVTLTLLLTLVVCAQLGAQSRPPALERRSVLGGKVSILLPVEFAPMSAELIQKKYPSANRPSVVFSNKQTTVNVALDHTAHRLSIDELAKAQESVRSAFKTSYPSAQWFRDEIKTINGRSFFLVDVRTPAIDTEVRNIFVGTSLDSRMLIITFNVTKALEAEWVAIANQILESITIS
jgi:hypothetical protein